MSSDSMGLSSAPTAPLSRRQFLRLAGAGLAAPWLGAGALVPARVPVPALGRITVARAPIRATAAVDGTLAGAYAFNDVVAVLGAAEGPGDYPHNSIWYQTQDGYVYSSYVQPVENAPQPVEWSLPPAGFWAEVSVPWVQARGRPDPAGWASYKLCYSCVFRVVSVTAAPDGSAWYGLAEWNLMAPSFYVPAESMRRLTEADLAPLSPGAEKYIKVALGTQTLEAYEGGTLVFSGRVCSGVAYYIDGKWRYYYTPKGRHRVLRKAPTSHMRGGTRGQADYYDLPGVGYCTYITASAVAVHAAYWHNDFGRPRSHGCLNMLPAEARWVYRWTEPAVPYDERNLIVPRDAGTIVEVVA